MMFSGNTRAHPALILVAILFGLAFSSLRYAFTTPPDDLWFQVRVIESQKPVIVKFGADWCGPCRAMDPELSRLRSRYSEKLDVVEIDIDEKPHLAKHYGVSGIPRIFLFKDGRLKKSRTGYASQKELLSWSESYFE
ncbi:thioredoxin family protein [Thalassoglobus sp.]|uniref:thioredoxin family protein n=1 Tax=Thalassoglobus sp. TaxID=2795869 RepID=UPI003AA87995